MAIYQTEYKLKISISGDQYQGTIWKNDNKFTNLFWPPEDVKISDLRNIERLTRASQLFFSHIPSGASVTIEFPDVLKIKDYVWSGRYVKKHPNAGRPENRESLLVWANISTNYKIEFYQNSKSRSGNVTTSSKGLRLKKSAASTFTSKIIIRKKEMLAAR